jgi:predicted nucleotidyltransferase
MDSVTEQIASEVKIFVESLKGRFVIRNAYLFGSRAERRARADSDIDIGLIVGGGLSPVDRRELFALGKEFDIDFDIVALSEREFETEDQVIVHEIKTKGIRLA